MINNINNLKESDTDGDEDKKIINEIIDEINIEIRALDYSNFKDIDQFDKDDDSSTNLLNSLSKQVM